jgi:hypothetical protein
MREDYLIYKRRRYIVTAEVIREAIADAGLHPAGTGLREHLDRARASGTREAVPAAGG